MRAGLKEVLIKNLLANRISKQDFYALRSVINQDDLSIIIQRIYDLNDNQVKKIAALTPVMTRLNALKNKRRNRRFLKKVRGGFRNKDRNKVVVVEGDSWFNYPVVLSDVTDWIAMENHIAVYSLASGGDWLLNMLSARKYVEQLSTLHPDVFIISGGGNDLVGSNRLAAIAEPSGKSEELKYSQWAQTVVRDSNPDVDLDPHRFNNGLRFLSKDFYALLMFFELQYYFIFNGILTANTGNPRNGKFPGIKIITQGYDYARPRRNLGFGLKLWRWYKPFIRLFLGHGSWLKTPLELRGIANKQDQEDMVYAMIYLFNEMMIETGKLFCEMCGRDAVCHVDSRGSVGSDDWTDELHPLPQRFRNTGKTFVDCINGVHSPKPLYTVNNLYPVRR
ncbi:MAG: hypothetical protein V4541_09480 [Bacteroidota bacterium]